MWRKRDLNTLIYQSKSILDYVFLQPWMLQFAVKHTPSKRVCVCLVNVCYCWWPCVCVCVDVCFQSWPLAGRSDCPIEAAQAAVRSVCRRCRGAGACPGPGNLHSCASQSNSDPSRWQQKHTHTHTRVTSEETDTQTHHRSCEEWFHTAAAR